LTRELAGVEVAEKFRKAGFHSLLCLPPALANADLTVSEVDLSPAQRQLMSGESPESNLNDVLPNVALFEKGWFDGNVEYLSNLSREEKDRVTAALFDTFHVDVFHIVS
jgi:hypothetical protein